MTISGVMPLRNAVLLGYPFEAAIRSLRPLCDEVVVLVDPTSEDDTLARVRALSPDKIVESAWDTGNYRGHTDCEISVQTAKACAAASGDWIMSLQADEMLHEREVAYIKDRVLRAERIGVTGIEMVRIYFYGSLAQYRADWTLWLLRLFKRGYWKPDVDGAMRFDPIDDKQHRDPINARIYHYSRVGDPWKIAERVRNLDRFFHHPAAVLDGDLPPYDFSAMRELDTYVIGHVPAPAAHGELISFPIGDHPQVAQEHFHVAAR